QFLCDLADGAAWSKWYYKPWEGLRALPTNTAVREALSRDPGVGESALLQLLNENRAGKVLRELSDADCLTVLRAFCATSSDNGTGEIATSYLQAAFRARLCIHSDNPLETYLVMRQNDSTLPSSPNVMLAIRAVIALARWMKSLQSNQLVSALRDSETGA